MIPIVTKVLTILIVARSCRGLCRSSGIKRSFARLLFRRRSRSLFLSVKKAISEAEMNASNANKTTTDSRLMMSFSKLPSLTAMSKRIKLGGSSKGS